jgi:protein pelota
MKVIIIGGLDVTRTDFITYMKKKCESLQDHNIISNQKKILQVHASSGHKNAIDEILSKEEIQNKLIDMKAANEVKALQKFKKKLSNQPDYTSYGYNHVQYADTLSLIDDLLIIDSLFQNADFNKRRQYITLIDSVREKNGNVYLFSKLHESGHQLDLYSGIAAVLRAPLVEYENQIDSLITSNEVNVFHVPSYFNNNNNNNNDNDDDDDDDINNLLDESTQEAMRAMGLLL